MMYKLFWRINSNFYKFRNYNFGINLKKFLFIKFKYKKKYNKNFLLQIYQTKTNKNYINI